MSKPKFAPGPWMAAAKPSSVVGWPVVAPSDMGRLICNVMPGTEFSAGNAALIAAAPAMYDALVAAEKMFRWYAELHAAKGPEHAEKAAQNRDMAAMCSTTLALARGKA